MESIVQMKGLSSSLNPAITGWQKYGPNLQIRKLIYEFLSILKDQITVINSTSYQKRMNLIENVINTTLLLSIYIHG